MANSNSVAWMVICACLLTLMMMSCSCSMVDAGGEQQQHPDLGWRATANESSCERSIAECVGEGAQDDELEMNIIGGTWGKHKDKEKGAKFLSYAMLLRNRVPCSHRGASYYNCRPGAQANPYQRGCNAITRCRSS